ncbi:PhoH family protein [Paenibacillus sp. ISL-20]|uniref:PhoH family protein n=1 Tax=Paenibacillus sp. ISL-20 TaxID=2819163 RepID=UPI001BE5B519|nr:PhoH family protein [Paenibacillus sp. ISL-20]MBT2759864.1 PhoH family protein [Paenibacillus sp. ISL-20]
MPLPKDCLLFGFANKLTDEQKIYVDSIFDNQVTIVNACAGSGKTTLAVACAKFLKRDLIYIFSPVEEDVLGYTPGDVFEKEEKYTVPLKDALLKINEDPTRAIVSQDNMQNVKNGTAWVYPMSHVFARGTNIEGNKLVVLDEAQNFTRGELKKILTRIHDEVKLVIIGHDKQCDLDNPKKSGFVPYIEFLKDEDYVKVCNLTQNFRGKLATKADQLDY